MTDNNGENRLAGRRTGPKCIAIVGPFGSGKTTLMEAILERTGAISRQAPAGSGNTVGDHGAEARAHGMGIEATVATTQFMGESITFIDCPGSVEFCDEANGALAACDAAIVVAEADAPQKLPALQLVLRKLDQIKVPRILFLNQIDKAKTGIREMLQLLQPLCETPLLLRQIPLTENGIVVGAIDLALERAYVYREHAASEVRDIPDEEKARELEARFSMLEKLADHDDSLMEELLSDIEPPRDQIFDDLSAELRAGQVVPVLLGSAENGNGILRLLKTIRHDCPGVEDTRARLGIEETKDAVCAVMKTIHTTHGGKLSVVRVLSGSLKDGLELTGSNGQTGRISGMSTVFGKEMKQVASAEAGDTVAIGKVEPAVTGMVLTSGRKPLPSLEQETAPAGLFDRAAAEGPQGRCPPFDRAEEAHRGRPVAVDPAGPGNGRGGAFGPWRDASARCGGTPRRQVPDPGRTRCADDPVPRDDPQDRQAARPAQEAVRRSWPVRRRVAGDQAARPRRGFRIHRHNHRRRGAQAVHPLGGDWRARFPQGRAARLSGGRYRRKPVRRLVPQCRFVRHGVSDGGKTRHARSDGRAAIRYCWSLTCGWRYRHPSEATARITALIPQRRGRILGYDSLPGWNGWDRVEVMLPLAETGDLIVDLRSATAGAASYTMQFDHMAELTGRVAEDVLAKTKAARAA